MRNLSFYILWENPTQNRKIRYEQYSDAQGWAFSFERQAVSGINSSVKVYHQKSRCIGFFIFLILLVEIMQSFKIYNRHQTFLKKRQSQNNYQTVLNKTDQTILHQISRDCLNFVMLKAQQTLVTQLYPVFCFLVFSYDYNHTFLKNFSLCCEICIPCSHFHS